MSDVSEPLIPLTKEEFIRDLRVQLSVMSQNGDIPQVKGKGKPVNPEVRRMELSIFAQALGERLWRSALRPMRIVQTNHASLHTGLAGPGWERDLAIKAGKHAHAAEVTAMIGAAAKQGPTRFTQSQADVLDATRRRED